MMAPRGLSYETRLYQVTAFVEGDRQRNGCSPSLSSTKCTPLKPLPDARLRFNAGGWEIARLFHLSLGPLPSLFLPEVYYSTGVGLVLAFDDMLPSSC